MPVKRFALVVVLAAPALAGCTWFGPVGSSSESSASEPSRAVSIYAAVVRQLVTEDHTFGGADPGFKVIYVVDGAVGRAARLSWPPGSPRTPFPEDLKRGLEAALEDLPPVKFVRSPGQALSDTVSGQVRKRGALVTLGPIRAGERRAEVGASLWIGGKAATWLTYVVRVRGGAWKVTGTTGPIVIA
jgi:hypothetical protein